MSSKRFHGNSRFPNVVGTYTEGSSAPAAPSWTPASLTDLWEWWHVKDSTVTRDVTGSSHKLVGSYAARIMTQSTVALAPTYNASDSRFAGQPTLEFSASSPDSLAEATYADEGWITQTNTGSGYGIALCWRFVSSATPNILFDFNFGNDLRSYITGSNKWGHSLHIAIPATTQSVRWDTAYTTEGTRWMAFSRTQGTGSSNTLFTVAGSGIAYTNYTGSNPPYKVETNTTALGYGFRLGKNGSQAANMVFAQMVVIRRPFTADETSKLGDYFNRTYGAEL